MLFGFANVDDGERARHFPFSRHERAISSIAFAPDDKTIASTSGDGTLRLWDVVTGMELRRTPLAHRGAIGRVAFADDGKLLNCATFDWDGKKGSIACWDTITGKEIRSISIGGPSSTSHARVRN